MMAKYLHKTFMSFSTPILVVQIQFSKYYLLYYPID